MAPLTVPTMEEVTGEGYGPLKAECDRIVGLGTMIIAGRCEVETDAAILEW